LIWNLFSIGGLFPGFWLALSSSLQAVERVLIAGGAVGYQLFALLLPGNNYIAGVPASIDDGTKVALEELWGLPLPYWLVLTARCLRWACFALMSL
jgi:hypothetical protein